MEFRVGSAPARSVGFSHGNTTAFDAGSEPPLVSVCVCFIFKRSHCCISEKTHP